MSDTPETDAVDAACHRRGLLTDRYSDMRDHAERMERGRVTTGKLFVFAKSGRIKCYSADELRPIQQEIEADGWVHTATIDPARWIEHMANGDDDPSDLLDELQFKPND